MKAVHAFRRLQAEWDEQHAAAPMPGARPCAALIIGCGLLVALVLILLWGGLPLVCGSGR